MAPCRQIGTSSMVLSSALIRSRRSAIVARTESRRVCSAIPLPERDEQLVAARPQSFPGRGDLGDGRLGQA